MPERQLVVPPTTMWVRNSRSATRRIVVMKVLTGRRQVVALSVFSAVAVLVTASQTSAVKSRLSNTVTAPGAVEVEQTPQAAPEPPAIEILPRTGASDVVPVGAVKVTATVGTLTDVRMQNEQGRVVAGRMVGADAPGSPPSHSDTDGPTGSARRAGALTPAPSRPFRSFLPSRRNPRSGSGWA